MIKQLFGADDSALEEIFKRRTSFTSVMDTVRRVADDVRSGGDAAVRKYTKQFDGVDLRDLEVSEDEMYNAVELIDYETIGHLEAAIDNIEAFHALQLPSGDMWLTEIAAGHQARPEVHAAAASRGVRAGRHGLLSVDSAHAHRAGAGGRRIRGHRVHAPEEGRHHTPANADRAGHGRSG